MPERRYICFYECRENQCEAISIDYDIAVAGRSLDEVKALLKSAIDSYIEDANRLEEPARQRLLNRRMPTRTRLRWLLKIIFHRLNLSRHASASEGQFEVACRA